MASTEMNWLEDCRARRRCDRRHALLVFGAAYPMCLALAIARRLVPGLRQGGGHGDPGGSVFRTAKATASSIVPFAFW